MASIPSIPSPSLSAPTIGSPGAAGPTTGGTTRAATETPINPAIASKLKTLFPGSTNAGTTFTPTTTIAVSDFFLNNYSINGTDWAKTYGYQFVILDAANGNNQIASLSFNLAPQTINIDVPTAVTTAVAMKGIVENHNGAPLRKISIRGTTGVQPQLIGDASSQPGSENTLDFMFKNTIQAAGAVATQANQFASTIGSLLGNTNTPNLPPLNLDTSDPVPGNASGYYWVHTLIRFLDSYLAYKKVRKYSAYRLQFRMYKDQMYWTCTLNGYSIRKLPGTLEYEYDINLTAWRRDVVSANNKAQTIATVNSQTLNKFATALSALTQARTLISTSLSVLQGVNADIQNSFMTPLREAILLGSEIVGAVETIADFPSTFIASIKASFYSALRASNQFNPNIASAVDQAVAKQNIYPSSATPVTNASQLGLGVSTTRSILNEQDSLAQATLTPIPNNGNPIEQIFNNPTANSAIFSMFPIDSLDLTPAQSAAVAAERARVSAYTVQDLKTNRDSIRSFMYATSQFFGGGNAAYNRIYNLPPPPVTSAKIDTYILELLSQMNDAVQAYDSMINLIQSLPTQPTNDYYQYYAALAQQNGLTFNNNTSKFYIPMPYGGSLESLAAQYLGNNDRWIEIAALNGLRDPYIDEVGFNVPLLVNAAANIVSVADTSKLFVGQAVQIQADNLQPTYSVISQIDILSSVQAYISLAGVGTDVTGYTVANNASIFAYEPDTVNSSMMIAIPTDNPVNVEGQIKLTPEPSDLTTLVQMAKVDFLLTSTGDVAITSAGDILFAIGVANLVQAANMKMQTEIGSIISNMLYGSPAQPGRSVADMSATDVIAMLQTAFNSDSRFGPVLAAQTEITGPTVAVSIVVQVANSSVNLPIVTQLPF
jgi:hypothetical protein